MNDAPSRSPFEGRERTDGAAERAQLENLMNSIPGGVATYRVRDGHRELIFHTDGVGGLTGRTRGEYEQLVAQGVENVIYPEDRPVVDEALTRAAMSDEAVSVAYRVPHKDGGYVWISVNYRRTGFDGRCPIIHAVFTPLSYRSQLYQSLADESGSGIVVRDAATYELYYVNSAARDMLSGSGGVIAGRRCYEYLHGGTEPCEYCRAAEFTKGAVTVGRLHIARLDRHFAVKGTVIDWGGREAVVEYIDEVTPLERSREALEDLVNNVSCGLIMCSVDRDGLARLQYMNDVYFSLCGAEREELTARMKRDALTGVHPEDAPAFRAMLDAVRTHLRDSELTYRYVTPAGELKWLTVRVRCVTHANGGATTYSTYTDVTDERSTAQLLRESEQTLELAAEYAGVWSWKYDAARRRAYLDTKNQREYGLPAVMENYPESWLEHGIIHPDYVEAYRDALSRIAGGERQVLFEARVYMRDKTPRWFRFCFTNVFDGGGRAQMAVCTGVPIDTEKELQTKYELERKKPSLGENDLLVHALFNLSTGETLEYAYQDGSDVPVEERTAPTGSQGNLEKLLIDPEERRRYRALNEPAHLLDLYARGKTELSMDYRRRLPGGDVIWVRNILHMVRSPSGSDVLLFEYCYDIEDEKMRSLMYESLAADNYDYVARIDGRTGRFVTFHRAELSYRMPPRQGEDSDAVVRALAGENVLPEDRALILENATLEGIRRNLADRDRFQFTYRELSPGGATRYKRVTEYYLDARRRLVMMTREDVTALIRAETEKNDMLAAALEAANQASQAKSQFLSRMSHELRTPMNAIIGLAALAAGDVENPAAMEDAIGKIGMSARYLLSLINDILEMSRIESGRMTLNEGPFDFSRLVSTVNTLIFEQAESRGVDYDAIAAGYLEPVYLGDATKLQQILVNVLGNAVKFTPAGGKITLTMEQLRRTSDRATLRFVISDTGVGIDREFLPHLFDAFSQESASFTSTSTGTGLGLAITKSMVEMMNGRISVESIKNVGSVFTVDVQLGIPEDSRRQQDMMAAMNLSRLRALVVDDDVIVCQSTQKILAAMGMGAEWVDSGHRAVERVTAAHAGDEDFDTIFIDWKMPDMDGIETTRQIRRIVGPDVTIIIMTAYDWHAFETQARAAGVDIFMEKPLLQSSIITAFEKVFTSRRDKIEPPPRRQYDFSGRRFLLAEDHPLNVEVARRLLERTGAQVTVANNGLEALETFTTSPTGWFDAILMDVRMPVMDGLAASRNIRALKKQGSREIPIIAMTANAFDEDVELSLSSGMDAHLIKPIDPQLLYSTIQSLVK